MIWKKLKIGSRVGIYWKEDSCYYPCTVEKREVHDSSSTASASSRSSARSKSAPRFFVRYDDGESEWIDDIAQEQLQWLDSSNGNDDDDKNKWKQLRIGSRIGIYWKDDNCYYPCTIEKWPKNEVVADDASKKSSSRFFVRYDDGDTEWIDNMAGERFQWLDNSNNRDENNGEHRKNKLLLASQSKTNNSMILEKLKIGSRIEIYWKKDKCYYPCMVEGQQRNDINDINEEEEENDDTGKWTGPSNSSRYFVRYDDNVTEWTDLAQENIRLLDNNNDDNDNDDGNGDTKKSTHHNSSSNTSDNTGSTNNDAKLPCLVYWYGEDLKTAFSFVPQRDCLTYEEGVARKLDQLPREMQQKVQRGEKFTKDEHKLRTALARMQQDRKRGCGGGTSSTDTTVGNKKLTAKGKAKLPVDIQPPFPKIREMHERIVSGDRLIAEILTEQGESDVDLLAWNI